MIKRNPNRTLTPIISQLCFDDDNILFSQVVEMFDKYLGLPARIGRSEIGYLAI